MKGQCPSSRPSGARRAQLTEGRARAASQESAKKDNTGSPGSSACHCSTCRADYSLRRVRELPGRASPRARG
ncbi:Hypothetical protein AA314_06214 [Archangium gephyra]|uniref:Uncharacterized protein n=1 Tax=Archangium gephyra TaxID=48 RepID=A0AAC8TG15_9BACT|nr:Hypothetical protein AA314_06214 [Archangium gephyra]